MTMHDLNLIPLNMMVINCAWTLDFIVADTSKKEPLRGATVLDRFYVESREEKIFVFKKRITSRRGLIHFLNCRGVVKDKRNKIVAAFYGIGSDQKANVIVISPLSELNTDCLIYEHFFSVESQKMNNMDIQILRG